MIVSPSTSTETIRNMARRGDFSKSQYDGSRKIRGASLPIAPPRSRQRMADQLYLSYTLRNFTQQNMLRHYEKLLRIFPFSRLARQASTFKVLGVDYNEPPVL